MSGGEPERKALWRYMPLAGLVRLLQTRSLHLARADAFEDALEGALGLSVVTEHLSFPNSPLTDHAVEALKRDCFLSCWHLAAAESLAMWRRYGRDESSVAVVSSVGSVMSMANSYCSDLQHCGMFGDVLYDNLIVDGRLRVTTVGLPFGYSTLPVPTSLQLFFYKGSDFEFEKEWRLVLWRKRSDASFVRVPIADAASFIDRILVSPEAPDWVLDVVTQLVQVQFGLRKVPVERSTLSTHLGAR